MLKKKNSILLAKAQAKHHAVSLSVSLDNPAVRLYKRIGFKAVAIGGDSLTMVISLKDKVIIGFWSLD
ncbi:MAG: hypothetical protein JXB26_18195 [Candidatus Aminicenantes bacterium]|nr:hypothetical protein [Candidatus Aminicenantes bacterium]